MAPIPSSLPRDPQQTPRTRRFLQKLSKQIIDKSLPLPPNVALTNAANDFTAKQKINSYYGDIHTDTDAPTVTFDMAAFNKHIVTITADRILALSGDQIGQAFLVLIKQGAGGSHLVTWWGGILWSSGLVPTLTVTAGKIDVFSFLKLSGGVYLGFIAGLNF